MAKNYRGQLDRARDASAHAEAGGVGEGEDEVDKVDEVDAYEKNIQDGRETRKGRYPLDC